jgi:hypothetical protein
MASGEMRPGEPSFPAIVLVSGLHAAMLPFLREPGADSHDFLTRSSDLDDRILGLHGIFVGHDPRDAG